MKRYQLSILGVTETHLPGEGEVTLDVGSGYSMIYSGTLDGRNVEGVGLAITARAKAAMRFHKAVSSRVLAAEFMTQVGPITVVVAYAPTERSGTEEKDNFYADLDDVMYRINGLVIVMGDFNATVGQEVDGVVGPFGLARRTSDNGHRLVDFATVHNLCLSNTYFEHKRIHQASWYPPDPSAKPSLKDYVLVKRRLHSSVLDTRVQGFIEVEI